MPKETVVVVDDEEHARNAVSRLLIANGYNVQSLSSGEEAIDYATSHNFDVLLTDFRMPGLDGLTTVRAVRKINPQIVAIIMTGNTSIDLAVQSLNLGVHGFVVKPFHGYELLNTIERTVERQTLIRENIKMKALVQVFAATEALITASDDNNEERLLRLTVEFTLQETKATDTALFLLEENKLVPTAIAYKDAPSDDFEDALLRETEYRANFAVADSAITTENAGDSIPLIFLRPDPSLFPTYKADGWPQVLENAQQALEAGTTVFSIDDEITDIETSRFVPTQNESCMLLVPMQVQGRKVGVLSVRRRHSENTFTEVELQTAAILAGQAAIAIDNSRLFHRLAHIEALREADQLRSEFVSTVSHELRTPLTSIKGYATTLLRPDVKWNDAVGRDYLNIISEECDKLMRLIDNILEVSKIEAGVLRIYPEPMQIREIIDYAVKEARHRSPEAVIEVSTPPTEELPLVQADSQRIIQVLRNLIGNAVKYSSGQARIRIKLSRPHRETTPEGNGNGNDQQQVMQIDVRDNGLGLSEEHRARVFERFYRVDVGSARKTEGTGLGLAICKGIVEAHGGRVWAESDGPGLGSTFSFTLPVSDFDLQLQPD